MLASFCYVPVHELHNILTISQRDLLIVVYCLTGCESTSSFFGHGKIRAFKKMMKSAENYNDLATLGSTPTLSQKQFSQSMMFVGELYGKTGCKSLNVFRWEKPNATLLRKSYLQRKTAFDCMACVVYTNLLYGAMLIYRFTILEIPLILVMKRTSSQEFFSRSYLASHQRFQSS